MSCWEARIQAVGRAQGITASLVFMLSSLKVSSARIRCMLLPNYCKFLVRTRVGSELFSPENVCSCITQKMKKYNLFVAEALKV